MPRQRSVKLLVLLGLVAAGGVLAFAGAAPEGYAGVADVVRDPASFQGKEMELKASVVEGSLVRDALPVTFLVEDGDAVLRVRWDPAVPLPDQDAGGTIEGRSVVVQGRLLADAEGTYLLARGMQVGCASKYRAA